MMSNLRPMLAQTLSDTLANLAFMFTDEEPAQIAPDAEWLEVQIAYQGPVSGGLILHCTRGFAVRLSANLLGVEPDQIMAAMGAEDSIREFANVLCGQLVTNLHNTEDVYNLTTPQFKMLAAPPPPGDDEKTIRLQVAGDPLQLTYVEPVECEAGR